MGDRVIGLVSMILFAGILVLLIRFPAQLETGETLMRRKTVSISYGVTLNAGNYESIRYEETETFVLDEDETWDAPTRSAAIKALKTKVAKTSKVLVVQHIKERTQG